MVRLNAWDDVVDSVRESVLGDPYWESRFSSSTSFTGGLHLAVLQEPYLGYVLEGRKTVESRFAKRRGAPYQCVSPGDAILLKRVSGPVVGLCEVGDVWYYRLTPASWDAIKTTFKQALCMDESGFWVARQNARFVTLMHIVRVRPLEPLSCDKTDRRGWVVVRASGPRLEEE